MDAPASKRVAKFLTDIGSRRGMLRTVVTGAASSALAGLGLASRTIEEAEAKKKRCKPKPVGALQQQQGVLLPDEPHLRQAERHAERRRYGSRHVLLWDQGRLMRHQAREH